MTPSQSVTSYSQIKTMFTRILLVKDIFEELPT